MKVFRVFALVLSVFVFPSTVSADGAAQYAARLAPTPVDFRSFSRITGLGQLHARLEGRYLELRGEFSGLQGAATVAHLHHGALAIPGPAVADLEVSQARDGELTGRVLLGDDLLKALEDRALYVQIHSEAAPEGNLRGWLLPVDMKEARKQDEN